MDRFSGFKRSTMIAALMVLSTGACAQRIAPPPQTAAPPPVAQVPSAPPVAQVPAPVTARPAPVTPPPVARAPLPPPRQVTAKPVQTPTVRSQARVETQPLPQSPVRTQVAEAPVPQEPQNKGLFDFLLNEAPEAEPQVTPPAAPEVALTEPAELGEQFKLAEVASSDYGTAVNSNPTPDSALDIAALNDPDMPPRPPSVATSPAEPEPEISEDGPAYTALASLFGGSDTEPDEGAPQAANTLDPSTTPGEGVQNPYPGGFDDDQSYDTAQLFQQSPGYGPSVAGYDPNAPVTVAILTPDTDSRPSIRTLAKGLAQAAALSARTLGNRQLVLRGYDTGGTPEKAQLAARQAIADGAQLIVGPLFSSSASAVAPVAQSAGVPIIAFTTDQSVLRRGVYSVGYLPDAEVERLLSYAAKRGIRKIGLLSPDTPYGGIVYRNVQSAAPGYGVNVATVQPISPNFAQAAETGQRFADFYKNAPDTQGVLIATNGKPLQGIAAYLAYNDVLPSKVQYMGLGTWDDPETFREATLRGGWFPGLDPALKAAFESRYTSAYSDKPPAIAALAFDGIAIAGALIKQAQATGQPPFTPQNIENPTGFRGMSGLFRFLPDGRNQRLLSILKVGRRQFEMIDPAPTTFGQRLTSITGYSQ